MSTSASSALILAAREYDVAKQPKYHVESSLYHTRKRADNEYLDFVVWMLGNKTQAIAMEAVGFIDQESSEHVLVLKHERLTEILGGSDAVVQQLLSNEHFEPLAFLSVLTDEELAAFAYDESHIRPHLTRIGEALGKRKNAHIFLQESRESDPFSFKEIAGWSQARFIVVAMLMDRDNMEDDAGDWMRSLKALTPGPGDDPDGTLFKSAGITLLREICLRRLQETVRSASRFT